MNKLLVASVYCDYSHNEVWSQLQKKFLTETTEVGYDYAVYLNRANSAFFKKDIIIGSTKKRNKRSISHDHASGLKHILEYFKNSHYDYCLILDSDCFPFAPNWFSSIIKKMGEFDLAAMLRLEDLSVYPHPAAMFFNRNALNFISFEPSLVMNFLNIDWLDVGGLIPLNKTYPLIRTNKYNPHPVFAGIYADTFYHHGCGSRKPHFKSQEHYEYTNEDNERLERIIFQSLMRNPEKFIKRLMSSNIVYM